MDLLEEIRTSNKKPKELLSYLSKKIIEDENLLHAFNESLKNGTSVEKGICMEVMEYASKENPEIATPFIENIIEYLNFEAPRVKWEAARVIANIADRYPEKSAKAVDSLLKNTKDKGTVVRWSAAFALGEIAKNNTKVQPELIPKLEKLVNGEDNNGVRNVYLKALKAIKK